MKNRVILHCDCNSFYASVEMAKNPKLKGVPLAVCGSVENRHGIVLAKNEEAKKYGIVTAETVSSAKKKCPTLVTVEPSHDDYIRYSKMVNSIYSEYTDLIEPFGIDESWLDVTASGVFGDGLQIAEKIRSRIKNEIGITVSIGVSYNKIFAKLGSDYKKPDAITVISEENVSEIVHPLPVGNLLFVGKKTEEQLNKMGIKTIGDLARTTPSLLVAKFGKAGSMLSDYARGLDDSPVSPPDEGDTKSIGNGFTFKHDLVGRDACRVGIDYLCEELGTKLRLKGLKCSTVQLTIRDEFFKTIQRQKPQNPPTDISSEIAKTAFAILCEHWNEDRPVRMLTVTAHNLVDKLNTGEQLGFFSDASDEKRELEEKRERAIDAIRSKFGSFSVVRASVINNDIGIVSGNKKNKK